MNRAYHHVIKHRKHNFRDSSNRDDRYHIKAILDSLIYISAVFGAFLNVPQLMKIWVDREIAGVSVITWIGFLLGSSFWFCYGIIHREKPIMLTNGLYVIIQFAIVLGLFTHGGTIALW